MQKIGLLDYIDLQILIRERHNKKSKNLDNFTIQDQKRIYDDILVQANNNMKLIVDDPLVEQLIDDLQRYKNIYIFGHLQASHIAYTLRANLAILSKLCYCTQSWSAQKDKIYQANDHDLFIIFSSTGEYFKRIDINMNRLKQSGAKVYIVTFEKGTEHIDDFINKIFIGKESDDPISNILMNMLVNYISFRLNHYVSKNETL